VSALVCLLVLVAAAACASGGPTATSSAGTAAPAGASSGVAPGTGAGAAAAAAVEPPVSVRIPYTAISVVNAPLWVAKEAGYFEQEGVNAELEFIATSTTVTQSMLSGEIALANCGLESLVSAN